MARRCGCSGSSCNCLVQAGSGTEVTGIGTASDPYIVSVNIDVADTATVDLTLAGDGSSGTPYALTADAHVKVEELENYSGDLPVNGEVLGYNAATQEWRPQAPSTAEVGSIVTDGGCLEGDGSVDFPLNVRLKPLGPLECGVDGLSAPYSPFPVNNQAQRDGITPRYVGLKAERLDLGGQIQRWNGTAWLYYGGPVQRTWQHWRNPSDQNAVTAITTVAAFIPIFSITLPSDAPAGAYRTETDWTIVGNQAAISFMRIEWGSTNISGDVRLDLINGVNHLHWPGTTFVHPGGSATITGSIYIDRAIAGQLLDGSSKMIVTYLGPQ